MLLETLKSLVMRSRKRKDLNIQTQSLPGLGKKPRSKPATTSSNNAHAPLYAEHPATTSTYFPNAQNFVINNSTAITNIIDSGGIALQLLAQKRIPGAEVDSSARDPPPKCHPDTRTSLRGRIIQWVHGPDRHWRMLWIIGPMGVGKSAIAQTIAEELKASGRLGASLFFSRPNHRDDPNGVIPTLVYQLAVKCPEYKRIITQRLADDVTILEKNRRTQFKELIIDPFHILMTRQPQLIQEPFLVILDGLDECDGKEAQCEFIELISDHVRQVDGFPLLWMICSRPEWHLKVLLSHPDFQVVCQREDIFIDDAEAQRDVSRVLEAGFKDIRLRFHDRLDVHWPPPASIRRIAVTASGHFAFASTIIKFVGDLNKSDPQTQLDTCIRFLGGFETPGAVNPLHALDLLYRQILSDVPRDILATTLRILGVLVLYSFHPGFTACMHANFLCINQSTFYRSLQHLHSVIDVPTAADALSYSLHFHHASFAEYLSDPFRSGSFSINKPAVYYEVATTSLRWLRDTILATETEQDPYPRPHPRVEWVHDKMDVAGITWYLSDFSLSVGLEACCNVSGEDIPRVVAELEDFDFRVLGSYIMRGVGAFLAWLYKLGDRNKSLIHMETSTDPVVQHTGTVSITHGADDFDGYLSIFGYHDAPRNSEAKLRLRLGRPSNICYIQLTVFQAEPFIPPSPTPSPSPPLCTTP